MLSDHPPLPSPAHLRMGVVRRRMTLQMVQIIASRGEGERETLLNKDGHCGGDACRADGGVKTPGQECPLRPSRVKGLRSVTNDQVITLLIPGTIFGELPSLFKDG